MKIKVYVLTGKGLCTYIPGMPLDHGACDAIIERGAGAWCMVRARLTSALSAASDVPPLLPGASSPAARNMFSRRLLRWRQPLAPALGVGEDDDDDADAPPAMRTCMHACVHNVGHCHCHCGSLSAAGALAGAGCCTARRSPQPPLPPQLAARHDAMMAHRSAGLCGGRQMPPPPPCGVRSAQRAASTTHPPAAPAPHAS